jgi:glucan phosphorylase
VVKQTGPLQLVFGGKAHPRDETGKQLIRRIHEASAALGDDLRVVYVENYEMASARCSRRAPTSGSTTRCARSKRRARAG